MIDPVALREAAINTIVHNDFTYVSGKNADIIIWIVRHAREEHKAAIEWLNNHTVENIGFFLCEIKLYRIGIFDPAVKFEVIEKPNDWTKEPRKMDSGSPIKQLRYDYWVAFIDHAFKNKVFAQNFRCRNPSNDQWMTFGVGCSECTPMVTQIQSRNVLSVELYINENKELFKSLYDVKNQIEREVNLSFQWRELPMQRRVGSLLNIRLTSRINVNGTNSLIGSSTYW